MNPKERDAATGPRRDAVEITRDYAYPRTSVFAMFTDADKAAKFWGPEGAVKLVFEFDATPGGAIRIEDRHADGNVARTSGTVTEVVVPELLVFRTATLLGAGGAPFEALQSVAFRELEPRKTRVTVRVTVLSTGSFPGTVESLEGGFMGGWGETLDMLERELG